MRILLPPSEAKRPGGRGKPLASRSTDSELDQVRAQTLAALARLVERPDAATALLLPASVAASALADNARVLLGGTLPAVQRYAGVVYDGLAVDTLSKSARSRANRELLVFSGLFGVLRGGDPIPPYRVPAKAVLPGLGVAGTFWRRHLSTLLPPLLDRGPILDLRSSDYAGMWQPARGSAEAGRLIPVRILSTAPSGRLTVISYNSKLAKGKLAAAVLEHEAAGHQVSSAADVAELWLELGGRAATETGTGLELVE
jgi:cytoplasmic iron level regulating protein YaaA (DUF328/UPF0246 family)